MMNLPPVRTDALCLFKGSGQADIIQIYYIAANQILNVELLASNYRISSLSWRWYQHLLLPYRLYAG